MVQPPTASSTTPAISIASSGGVCRRPRLPISVVAFASQPKMVLGTHPALVHPVHAPPAHPDNAPIPNGYIQSIVVGVEDGGGLDPAIYPFLGDTLFEEEVHPDGPPLAGLERRTLAPGVCYARSVTASPLHCKSHPRPY